MVKYRLPPRGLHGPVACITPSPGPTYRFLPPRRVERLTPVLIPQFQQLTVRFVLRVPAAAAVVFRLYHVAHTPCQRTWTFHLIQTLLDTTVLQRLWIMRWFTAVGYRWPRWTPGSSG